MGSATSTPTFQAVASNIKGSTTGTAPAAGYIGEVKKATGTVITLAVSGTVYNALSLTLEAGSWMVFGKVAFGTAGTSRLSTSCSISTTSAVVDLESQIFNEQGINGFLVQATGVKFLTLAATTTVYLTASSTFAGTAPTCEGSDNRTRLQAIRTA